MRDNIFFVMFPIYSETRKRDVVTDNYLYPFFDWQRGDGLRGWQFWPVFGVRHKVVTTVTNGFGDAEIVSGYDKYFALWPIHVWQNTGIGTDNPEKFRADLPFYSCIRARPSSIRPRCSGRFSTGLTTARKNIASGRRRGRLWFSRGAKARPPRACSRCSASRATNTLESDSYLWPFYCHNGGAFRPAGTDAQQRPVLHLFRRDRKNTQTGAEKKRLDMWPFFTWHRDFNGNERLQIFAPVEPALPNNRGVERNWSPLWSLWRAGAQCPKPAPPASRCSGIFTAATRRRTRNNARSCSAFSSINRGRREKSQSCFTFPFPKPNPRQDK